MKLASAKCQSSIQYSYPRNGPVILVTRGPCYVHTMQLPDEFEDEIVPRRGSGPYTAASIAGNEGKNVLLFDGSGHPTDIVITSDNYDKLREKFPARYG